MCFFNCLWIVSKTEILLNDSVVIFSNYTVIFFIFYHSVFLIFRKIIVASVLVLHFFFFRKILKSLVTIFSFLVFFLFQKDFDTFHCLLLKLFYISKHFNNIQLALLYVWKKIWLIFFIHLKTLILCDLLNL